MERSGADGALSASSAVQEVSREFGIPVISIGNLEDLFGYLAADPALARFGLPGEPAALREREGGRRGGHVLPMRP